jgi:hypothetical protein
MRTLRPFPDERPCTMCHTPSTPGTACMVGAVFIFMFLGHRGYAKAGKASFLGADLRL